MKKRIFVALKVPSLLSGEAMGWIRKHSDFPVRWVNEKNLHITVIPPWEEGEESVALVMDKLKAIEGKTGPINLVFDSVSYGPNNFSPRLIWATGDISQKLINLRESLKDLLGRSNHRNGFFTHLTLARFDTKDLDKFSTKKLYEEVYWGGLAENLVLLESNLLPDGPEYTVLEEIKL